MSEQELVALIEGFGTEVAVAMAYSELLTTEDVNWGRINRAIERRWSRTELLSIKRLAWSIAAATQKTESVDEVGQYEQKDAR